MQADNFITRNWQNLVWIAGLIFAAGGAWSEFRELHKEIDYLKKEITDIRKQSFEELEQRTDDLEEWREYLKGLHDGTNSQAGATE